MPGIGDIARNVLWSFKGDTSDLKSKVKELRGVQRQAAKEQLREVEKQNEKLENQIATWGKVAIGVGSAVAAYKLATGAMDKYAERSRLMSTAAGKDIDGLKKSTSGLISEMDLLKLAADANTGTFQLTQKQLELVGQGIVALSREGRDLTQVTERVGQAIREGNVEPLKEFGIVIKDVEGDSIQALNAILAKFQEMGPGVEQAGEAMKRTEVEVTNATDSMAAGFGALTASIVATTAAILDFTGVSGGLGSPADLARKKLATLDADELAWMKDLGFSDSDIQSILGKRDALIAAPANEQSGADWRARVSQTTLALEPYRRAAEAENARKDAAARRAAEKAAAEQEILDEIKAAEARSKAFGERSVGVLGTVSLPPGFSTGDIAGPGAVGDELSADISALPPSMRRPRGPGTGRKEFDSMIQTAVAGSEAFAMFKGAAMDAFQSIVTGTATVGQAFKKMVGNMVLGQSMKAFANGLQAVGEGALAFVLSGFNPAAAQPFAAAAAQNFAIAVSLGAIARGLGAGGAGSSGGAGGAGAGMSNGIGPRFGVNPNNRTQNTTIILGDSFSSRSERERNRDLSGSLKRARLSSDANPAGSA